MPRKHIVQLNNSTNFVNIAYCSPCFHLCNILKTVLFFFNLINITKAGFQVPFSLQITKKCYSVSITRLEIYSYINRFFSFISNFFHQKITLLLLSSYSVLLVKKTHDAATSLTSLCFANARTDPGQNHL